MFEEDFLLDKIVVLAGYPAIRRVGYPAGYPVNETGYPAG